jgi:hypothetical protein
MIFSTYLVSSILRYKIIIDNQLVTKIRYKNKAQIIGKTQNPLVPSPSLIKQGYFMAVGIAQPH